MRILTKRRVFLITLTVLIINSGFFVGKIFATEGVDHVVISEIQIGGETANDEFVELYNSTNQNVNLSGWDIKRKTKSGKKEYNLLIDIEGIIFAHDYFLITPRANCGDDKNEKCFTGDIKADDQYTTNSYLAKDNTVLLYDDEGKLIDKVGWGFASDVEGESTLNISDSYSLQRESKDGKIQDTDNNREDFLVSNNPNPQNSSEYNNEDDKNGEGDESEEDEIPIEYSLKIRINEVVPNPEGSDYDNEYIELYNFSDEDINLDEGWMLADANRKNKKETGKTKKIEGIIKKNGGFLKIKKTVSLNNDWDIIYLFNPNNEEVCRVSYDEAEEDFSYSFDGERWRWTPILTPNKKNEFPIPKEYAEKIYLNEILPNPSGEEKSGEYIELYNLEKGKVDLSGWILRDASKSGKFIFPENSSIKAKGYLAVYRSDFGFAMNNSGKEKIYLLNPNEKIVSSVSYLKAEEDISYNFNGQKWRWSRFLTPGKINKFEVKKTYNQSIRLNEILPNPSGEEKSGEYIELYNLEKGKVDLSGWILRDASKSGKFIFPENSSIKAKGYLAVYRSDFGFAMNNSGGETVRLLDPNGNVVFSVSYDKAKEDVSYNFDGSGWRWSRFLTPGRENEFNQPPRIEIDIDKKIYKNIYADFKVKINDPDKDKIKVVWDFGDGHKSYKKKTRHKYKNKGKYSASLKVFDGSEEVVKKFKIEVKKFPRPKARITRLMPNPKGKDSELEWIEIKNKSSKEINLKNWSIATGSSSKKITNHPIGEDFFIRPGKTEKITRDISKFSLNNKKCHVELRYPDGKVAYKVKYKKEDGVEEGEIYGKNKGEKWKWMKDVEDILGFQNAQGEDGVEGVMNIPDVEVAQEAEDEKKRLEYEKFIGGYSVKLYNNKKSELLVGKLGSEEVKKLMVDFANSSIEEVNDVYAFNSLTKEDKHYAAKFLENLMREINQALNNWLNLLN